MVTDEAVTEGQRVRGAQGSDLFASLVQAASSVPRDHLAVVDANSSITYTELVRASSEFCEGLATVGIQPGERLGVFLENRKEFLVAAFGAWKHGAILTTLNPQLHVRELAEHLQSSSVRAVATSSRSAQAISALCVSGVAIEHSWFCSQQDQWTHAPGVSQTTHVSSVDTDQASGGAGPSTPALTQYSTGSTGYPKRITRTHAQLIGEARSCADILRLTSADRVLGAAPFFHSYGLCVSALMTLLQGATLYVTDTFLPGNIGRLVEGERLSGFPGVPFMFQLLAECGEPIDLSSLRFLLSAGAPLSPAIADSFAERYRLRIRRLYGSTETGVIAMSHEDGGNDAGSVGIAIPGVRVEVIDDAHRPLPPEQVGLLKIVSEFAASAYDGRSNSESYFLDAAFVPGDLGSITGSGEILLQGRRRSFINVNGLKVDPSEVEAVLLEMPEVAEAVVLGVSDGAGGERIKAVLVSKTHASERAVRAHCVQRIAAFKCPHIIEFRSALPRNRLGKILRQCLLEQPQTSAPG